MERRVTGNCHARCEAGEKAEIISKSYLSLKVSTLHGVCCAGVTHIRAYTELREIDSNNTFPRDFSQRDCAGVKPVKINLQG